MRGIAFVACAVLVSCAARPQEKRADAPSDERPRDLALRPEEPFEVLCVDDSVDPFEGVTEEAVPPGAGISLQREIAPVGLGKLNQVHFARILFREGEPTGNALERFSPWLAQVAKLPPDGRFAFGDVVERGKKGSESVVGLRTYVLTGIAFLTRSDVVDAFVSENDDDVPDISLALRLSEQGAQVLKLATSRWIGHRVAILSHGNVMSAPVVRGVIEGGHLQMVIGPRSDANVARANELVRDLLQK